MTDRDGTRTQQLVAHLLADKGGLREYIQSRRATNRSWRLIALDIRDDTAIDVTHETVRSWARAYEDASAAPLAASG